MEEKYLVGSMDKFIFDVKTFIFIYLHSKTNIEYSIWNETCTKYWYPNLWLVGSSRQSRITLGCRNVVADDNLGDGTTFRKLFLALIGSCRQNKYCDQLEPRIVFKR